MGERQPNRVRRLSLARGKQRGRLVSIFAGRQLLQPFSRLRPERAASPFIAFPVQFGFDQTLHTGMSERMGSRPAYLNSRFVKIERNAG